MSYKIVAARVFGECYDSRKGEVIDKSETYEGARGLQLEHTKRLGGRWAVWLRNEKRFDMRPALSSTKT